MATKREIKTIVKKLVGKTIVIADYKSTSDTYASRTDYKVEGVADCGGHTVGIFTIINNEQQHTLWLNHDTVLELNRIGIATKTLTNFIRRIFVI